MTRAVVRPHRKNGGTTLVFRLTRPAVLRITIVRVYPTCKRFGTFTVRGRAGVNRIRFRGRLRGRALPEGGYRLIVRARGARRDAAAVPIVIARGALSSTAVRKLRAASVCSEPVADLRPQGAVARIDGSSPSGGVLATIKHRIKGSLGSATGAIVRTARGLTERAKAVSDDPLDNPFILTIVGLIALTSSILGAIVLTQIARATVLRDF